MKKTQDNPMQRAPRCSAKSKRSGKRCQAPAVRGKHICRMHGAFSGAPRGTAHGQYRHGRYTCEAIASRRQLAELIQEARRTIDALI
ncbi:hypothetical protein [Mesorhizobium sp. WSM2240]|uniref:Uncharacterized protein n=1 Tax=Mesorhizobium sp. WSM2240 TaxID=3228851 RepID=A0AAU8CNS1_9HYPH